MFNLHKFVANIYSFVYCCFCTANYLETKAKIDQTSFLVRHCAWHRDLLNIITTYIGLKASHILEISVFSFRRNLFQTGQFFCVLLFLHCQLFGNKSQNWSDFIFGTWLCVAAASYQYNCRDVMWYALLFLLELNRTHVLILWLKVFCQSCHTVILHINYRYWGLKNSTQRLICLCGGLYRQLIV